jgi:tripartite-type tricarboxylate transporter receptor subunit TctC
VKFSMMRVAVACLALAGLSLTVSNAGAQEKFPTKPIKVLVPYAPGGATDIVARVIGEHMRQSLGQGIVVENKPGSFGIAAIQDMAKSKPDGYTLMIGNVSTNTITPILHKQKFSIDYEKSVVPVTRLVDIPAFIVLTTKNFAPKTLPEFIAYAKAHKGKVYYGHVGAGSYPQYDAEVFAKRAGIEITAIPNKAGASGIIRDMLTGDVQMAFLNVASSASLVRSGQLRAVALVNPKRLPEYPDVPTMEELGYKGVGTLAWQGMFAPAGTPKNVLETIYKSTLEALKSPEVVSTFAKQHFNIVPNASIDEAKTWAADDRAAWTKITQEVKVDLGE